jgi:hypothetical protein
MAFDAVEWHARVKAKKRLREDYGPMVVSAVESLEAAVWLLGGYLVPQSLAMFHNAVELLFKAELARIHLAMIADPRQLKFEDLKALFRDQVRSHPRGSAMQIPEFSIERTITFSDAMKRVKEFYPATVSKWEAKLVGLNDLRNDVTHYGGDTEAVGRYLLGILLTAVPFCREFMKEAYGTDIDNVLFESVNREVQVAANTVEELQRDGSALGTYVLNTVSVLLRYRWGLAPEFVDDRGAIRDEDERDFELAQQAKKEFEKAGSDVDAEETCKICGAYPAFVCFEVHNRRAKTVRATAIKCFKCGLDVGAEDKHLAHFHHGPVEQTDAEKFLKSIGEL